VPRSLDFRVAYRIILRPATHLDGNILVLELCDLFYAEMENDRNPVAGDIGEVLSRVAA
jgi:hypothetical protein